MCCGSHDGGMSLQHYGRLFVRAAGDDDGGAFVYSVPEAAYFVAVPIGLCAGNHLFAVVSVFEMSGSIYYICGGEGTASYRSDRRRGGRT